MRVGGYTKDGEYMVFVFEDCGLVKKPDQNFVYRSTFRAMDGLIWANDCVANFEINTTVTDIREISDLRFLYNHGIDVTSLFNLDTGDGFFSKDLLGATGLWMRAPK